MRTLDVDARQLLRGRRRPTSTSTQVTLHQTQVWQIAPCTYCVCVNMSLFAKILWTLTLLLAACHCTQSEEDFTEPGKHRLRIALTYY